MGTIEPPGGPACEIYAPGSGGNGTTQLGGGYAIEDPSASGWLGGHHQPQPRPSLPTLHTRSSFLDGYDQYESSPADSYTYAPAIIPRQDSFTSSYAPVENYRSWSATGAPLSAPVTGTYYEQQPAYSFGNLQAPSFPPASINRLPSVTADSFSPLNMGSLHSSLPIQTAQERRLPAPYTVHYPPTPYPNTEQLPEIRPLGCFSEPRAHIHGIHSRTAMPWSSEGSSTGARTMSAGNSMAPLTGIPAPPAQQQHHHRHPQQQQHTVPPVSEPAFGYQFGPSTNLPTSSSPEISPTTAPTLQSFSSTASSGSSASMPPPSATFRYAQQALPTLNHDEQRPTTTTTSSSAREGMQAASLYSFSTDTGEQQRSSTASAGGSDQAAISLNNASGGGGGHSYVPLRQPQPQHTTNVEALGRQSSFEQQRAQTTVHRMSVSNLNARY